MKTKKPYTMPENIMSGPLIFDEEICNGCNKCVNVCQVDILIPNPVKNKPPIVLYPGECWYGGCCVAICPLPGAITLRNQRMNSVSWKRKKTGELFRL